MKREELAALVDIGLCQLSAAKPGDVVVLQYDPEAISHYEAADIAHALSDAVNALPEQIRKNLAGLPLVTLPTNVRLFVQVGLCATCHRPVKDNPERHVSINTVDHGPIWLCGVTLNEESKASSGVACEPLE